MTIVSRFYKYLYWICNGPGLAGLGDIVLGTRLGSKVVYGIGVKLVHFGGLGFGNEKIFIDNDNDNGGKYMRLGGNTI